MDRPGHDDVEHVPTRDRRRPAPPEHSSYNSSFSGRAMTPPKKPRTSSYGSTTTGASSLPSPSPLSSMNPYSHDAYKPPGRLGELSMELHSDPRADPRILSTLAPFGLDRTRAPRSLTTLSQTSTIRELGASMSEAEREYQNVSEAMHNELPGDAYELEVERWTECIAGPDGNAVALHVTRPAIKGGLLPGIVFFHGGGMTIGGPLSKVNARWCTSLAAAGMICIAVDFRNAWSDLTGHHPFPAGLNDCCTAVQYIHSNRSVLDIRHLVLQGFDGGANLALAVALQAKREKWLYQIAGVYACSPYISNAYGWTSDRKLRELPSLIENNGYFISLAHRAYMAYVYTPRSSDSTNPLAWPYHASKADLEGLPPHILSMEELDPLRDEGIAYARKLTAAGVSAVGKVTVGATHEACLMFRKAVPMLHQEAVRDVVAFAKAV